MRTLAQDLRHALRTLAARPGFTVAAVLTLALGIGATGSVASVLRALLLRPLPYAQPDRVVMVWTRFADFPKTWVSVPEFRAYADSGAFAGLALFDPGKTNLTGGEEPERVGSAVVSANLFAVLGVEPILGRAFTAAEVGDRPAAVVILSEELWRRRFGGKPSIVGASIEINQRLTTVVGVMPAGFKLPFDYNSPAPSELWQPLDEALGGAYTVPPRGGDHNYYAVGRLRARLSLDAARARLRGLAGSWTSSGIFRREDHFEPLVIPVVADILGSLRMGLLVLAGAVGFVLMIACANVANLLLVRGLQRRRELAVRMALGASPGRLVRQLLTESAVLAVLGGAGGLWLTYLGIRAILLLGRDEIPRAGEVGMDLWVVAFVVLVSLATALVFGLAPARRFSRPDLRASLQQGGRAAAGSGGEGGRLQGLMVVVQVALAVVLLMGASLMIRTVLALSRVNPGFQAANVLTMGVSPARVKYPRPELLAGLYDSLLARIRQVPGVRAAGAVRILPLTTEMGDWGIDVEGYAPPPGERVKGDWQTVTPGYFEAMGVPLKQGRLFTAADRRDAQPVIIINQAMAQKFWPGRDPIGRRIRVRGSGASRWSSIIGVVGDVRHDGLTAQVKEAWYLPQSQIDLSTGFPVYEMTLVMKTDREPAALAGAARDAIHAVDPRLPVSEVRPLREVVAGALSRQRFTMSFLVIFSSLALALAAVGIYGVMRFRVGARTREIGLRMALGARAGEVVWRVVAQGMRLVAAGLGIGAIATLGLSRFLSGLLYGVEATDPNTLLAAAATLALVALAATWLPARRAALVDPQIVLREE